VKAGQLMYGAYREEAARLEREKAPAAVQLAALQAAIGYGKLPLDLQAKVGDLKAELRDFSGASQAYDQVVSLANKLPERDRPTPNAIKRYDGLAFQYEQLADKPVPRQAGLRNYLQTDRSVQIAPASVSVQFHFDSDEMTGGGELQAESLFKLLNEQRMPKIHLVGHTDPKGTHEYNDALSIRRAKALKVFLVKKGYRDSDITIDGRGKREADTFQVYDRDKFSKDQIHQILRRVALDSRHK
jgi:outer membrane protein OmpA-like peptidoglycan-associated protein